MIHVRFPSLTSRRTTSGGIYVISLLVDDMMSSPSNISSSEGMCRNRRGISGVPSLSPLMLSDDDGAVDGAGVGVRGVGVGGGVQWLLRRTARPVLSDSLNASRVLRRRIYNKIVNLSSLLMLFIWCQHRGINVVFLLCRYWNVFTRNLNHACHKVPCADVWWNVPSRKESNGWL